MHSPACNLSKTNKISLQYWIASLMSRSLNFSLVLVIFQIACSFSSMMNWLVGGQILAAFSRIKSRMSFTLPDDVFPLKIRNVKSWALDMCLESYIVRHLMQRQSDNKTLPSCGIIQPKQSFFRHSSADMYDPFS